MTELEIRELQFLYLLRNAKNSDDLQVIAESAITAYQTQPQVCEGQPPAPFLIVPEIYS